MADIYAASVPAYADVDDIKNCDPTAVCGSTPVSGGVLKYRSGGTFVNAQLLVYFGAAWVAKPVMRWTGAEWLEVDATGA